jgi:4,5-dihydroxyphthalate decarboxylase
MSRVALSVACGIYDRTFLLANGTIRPEGVDLHWLDLPPWQIFYRMLRNLEFEVSEMSLSNYLTEISTGSPRFVAIPVFLSRLFRHSCIFVNSRSGIKDPKDLKGRRVGAPEYSMTALLWIRALLKHQYGVDPSDLRWFVGGLNASTQEEGRDRIDIVYPPEISITRIAERATLNDMLLEDELDAIFCASAPRAFLQGDSGIKRLFPDSRVIEEEYYRKTGLFPIMHIIVLRKDIYDRYPWAARNLYDAFLEAKDQGLSRLFSTSSTLCSLPWLVNEAEKARELFGKDIWPYGIAANRHVLEATIRFAREQFLIRSNIDLDQVFASETFRT